MENNSKEPVDFVIVTALREELDPVLSLLPDHQKLDKELGEAHTYYEATIETSRIDQAKYRIILTCMSGMGPENAAIKANAIMKWQPRYVILTGICGGLKGETQIGDVAISDQIADYVLGKIIEVKPSSRTATVNNRTAAKKTARDRRKKSISAERITRWEAFPADATLLDSANNLVNGWQTLIQVPRPKSGGQSSRHIGTLVSGGNVIAASEILEEYKKAWPKLIGVEMEGGGTAKTLHNSGTRPGLLMIKGVSDLADSNKNSRTTKVWRPYARAVAAAYTIALIRSGPVPAIVKQEGDVKILSTSSAGSIIDAFQANASKLESMLAGISSQIEASNSPRISMTENLGRLLEQAEADNPGISFRATTSPKGTTYHICANSRVQDGQLVGNLIFDSTSRMGKLGLERFKEAIEQGTGVRLTKEECQFEKLLKIPAGLIEGNQEYIDIKPYVPSIKIPVALHAIKDSEKISIEFAYLTIERWGTAALEFLITGSRLAGNVRFCINHVPYQPSNVTSSKIKLEIDLCNIEPIDAIKTMQLLSQIRTGSILKVESLEFGPLIEGHVNNSDISPEYIDIVLPVLSAIDAINKEFNMNLKFPAELYPNDAQLYKRIANGILNGTAIEDTPGTLSMDLLKPGVLLFYDKIPEEGASFEYIDMKVNFFGTIVDLGNVEVRFLDWKFLKPRIQVENEIEVISDEDIYKLELSYKQICYFFSKWKNRAKKGQS